MFEPVSVQISNCCDVSVERHPFAIGVPWAEGVLSSPEKLRLTYKDQPAQFNTTVLANWPDGSIKWLLLDFQASMDVNEQAVYQLVSDKSTVAYKAQSAELASLDISEADDYYLVNTGPARFTINKYKLGLFTQVVYDNQEMLSDSSSDFRLLDEQGHPLTPVISGITFPDSENTLRKRVCIDGLFRNASKDRLAGFSLTLTFYAGLPTIKCDFTLLNPGAAEHPGGVWDLGDNGSFMFKELSVNIPFAGSDNKYNSSIRFAPDAEWRSVENAALTLEQNSSGGENWQSRNHVNNCGEVPLAFKGFQYCEHGKQVSSGDRATPSLYMTSAGKGITAYISDFWQNFPKGFQVDQTGLSLNLFPLNATGCYELQGGERKKHTFYLDFSNDKNSLDGYIKGVAPALSTDYYSRAKVIPWLAGDHEDSVMQQLINRGIQGDNNFFDKRETIDEYGWRNFGEVYADHEKLEYKGNDEFISHYNNQYDALYGFIKQYLVSGDERWHELLSKLAQHIVDIDIYHTIEDRDEYNGGLFWHTHHYLTAFTCTHRTFSSKHAADFLYGEIGGGPGAEHCYTTGLSYYYFMTGEEVYKDAALKIVHWVSRVLEGSGTVIERVFQFKSREVPILKRLLAGETVQRYSYPFTRGTGNYITSLIDAYNLTGDRQYILNAERVIQQSIHPNDDIKLRNLKDTEASWSYLIYLQAVGKYLYLKTSLKEIDDACLYAKDSLLHYADWMLENEEPFLQNPENLEYANHTWTAQDLRKAGIFYIASLYSEDKKTEYLKSAHFYVRYVEDTLSDEETRHFSRILILLMQNDIHESGLDYQSAMPLRTLSSSEPYTSAPLYSVTGIVATFIGDLFSRILNLSIKNEKRWLSVRMK